MPSPFPGMNPYLEHPDRWSTVHNRLIVALADWLTPQLLPKYQVDIEKRVYEVIGLNSLLVGRPDVTVQRARQDGVEAAAKVLVSATPIEPIQVTVPMAEEVREAYLESKGCDKRWGRCQVCGGCPIHRIPAIQPGNPLRAVCEWLPQTAGWHPA